MDVKNIGEVQSVTALEEEGHTGDETEHGRVVVGIDVANNNEESTSDKTV
jgi:hypothetical protein